jgi:hypothetical protein
VKDSKLNKVLEGYKPIPMKRLFYPRGMQLSEDFVNAFHREYDRLVDEGVNPRTLVERFGKAMKFHANETRKYHQLDEAGNTPNWSPAPESSTQKRTRQKLETKEKDIRADVNSLKQDPHEGDRGEAKRGGKKPALPEVPKVGSGKPWATRKQDVEHGKKTKRIKNIDKWSKDQS